MSTRNFTKTLFTLFILTLSFLFAETLEVPFDTTNVDQTVDQVIIFENTGDLPLEISNILLDSEVFIMESSEDITIESGEEIELVINFTPNSDGDHEAILTFETNDPDNETVELLLMGNATSPTSIEDGLALPETFELSQNYPNPFNPSTTIKYQVPENAKVNMVVYNMTGQKVATLKNENQQAGYHNVMWNGRNDFGQQVSSGVYLLRMQAGSYAETIAMTFTK